MRNGLFLLLTASFILFCACGDKPTTVEEFYTRAVTLPDKTVVHAEVAMKAEDMLRGLMFRDSMPLDHGMLFIHGKPQRVSYWMHNCRFPLDIIWMDPQHKVVETSADTPPCPASRKADECPNYGGHEEAQYVLELNAGQAAKHGVRVGSTIDF